MTLLLNQLDDRQELLLRMGDNALILGQRLGEWCGHGPVLEQDIAMTNIALDLIGQARTWLSLAGQSFEPARTEDDIAFLRDAWDFRNVLLVEQQNGDFASTITRQFFFDTMHYLLLDHLSGCQDEEIRAIAAKALKEVAYHLRYSSEWVIRLGDGTGESRERMQTAISDLWTFTGELTRYDEVENRLAQTGILPREETLRAFWNDKVKEIFAEATLEVPDESWMQGGGKQGRHTENLGFILADMQFLQRAYPGMEW